MSTNSTAAGGALCAGCAASTISQPLSSIHLTLLIGQAALWIVQDQTRAQRRKGRIDVDRIGVTGEIHRMHAVIREVTAQPFDPFRFVVNPCCTTKITAKTQDVSGIKQWLFFGGHKELFFGPLQALRSPILSLDNRDGSLHRSGAAWAQLRGESLDRRRNTAA